MMEEFYMENERIEEIVDNTDYIAAIKELKQNSVSKDEYAKLKEQNKQLLDSLVKGEYLEQSPQTKRPIEDIRNDLFNNEHNNLETVRLSLELRERIIEEGGTDPFLPYGEKIIPTDEDIATANRVAQVMQECIDYAEGDSAAFTNELQRRTIDTAPRRR